MNKAVRIKHLAKRYKILMLNARNRFESLTEELSFSGFGDRTPELMTSNDGELFLTWDDVDIPLEEFDPILKREGCITRSYWESLVTNELLTRY